MKKKYPLPVHLRAFSIWRHLGFMPWKKEKGKALEQVADGHDAKKGSRDFYKGAFDGIPFLNDDAKRTFQHLLLRPGHMIRDYIGGQHERYLAPLTSLIIFYAFFALISALLQPVQRNEGWLSNEIAQDTTVIGHDFERLSKNISHIVRQGYLFLHLDRYPEAVKTQRQAAVAALEATLRSQGIPLFISEFFFLWLAMAMALRRYRMGMSAYAAASAYVLCQFSFFMLFAVLLTWGRSSEISILLMGALLTLDYHQWLGLEWEKSFRRALATGVCYGLIYGAMLLLVSFVVLVLAFLKL